MINHDELAICKRRGHDAPGLGIAQFGLWMKCKWCGMWLRAVRSFEEREEEPPQAEQSPLGKLPRG